MVSIPIYTVGKNSIMLSASPEIILFNINNIDENRNYGLFVACIESAQMDKKTITKFLEDGQIMINDDLTIVTIGSTRFGINKVLKNQSKYFKQMLYYVDDYKIFYTKEDDFVNVHIYEHDDTEYYILLGTCVADLEKLIEAIQNASIKIYKNLDHLKMILDGTTYILFMSKHSMNKISKRNNTSQNTECLTLRPSQNTEFSTLRSSQNTECLTLDILIKTNPSQNVIMPKNIVQETNPSQNEIMSENIVRKTDKSQNNVSDSNYSDLTSIPSPNTSSNSNNKHFLLNNEQRMNNTINNESNDEQRVNNESVVNDDVGGDIDITKIHDIITGGVGYNVISGYCNVVDVGNEDIENIRNIMRDNIVHTLILSTGKSIKHLANVCGNVKTLIIKYVPCRVYETVIDEFTFCNVRKIILYDFPSSQSFSTNVMNIRKNGKLEKLIFYNCGEANFYSHDLKNISMVLRDIYCDEKYLPKGKLINSNLFSWTEHNQNKRKKQKDYDSNDEEEYCEEIYDIYATKSGRITKKRPYSE